MTLEKSSNYEDIKKAIDTYETHLEIFMGVSMISRVWIIPYNGGIDTIADYTVNKQIDDWSDKFEQLEFNFK